MAKKYYMPRPDPDKLSWLLNFSQKISTYNVLLNVTPAEVTFIGDFYDYYAYVLSSIGSFKTYGQDLIEYKKNLLSGPVGSVLGGFPSVPVLAAAPTATGAGSLTIMQTLVQRIKNHPNYTTAIGEDLGIIGADLTHDPASAKVVLRGSFKNNQAVIQFNSFALADGIRLESMRGTETQYVFLANDTEAPYTDTRAKLDPTKPEARKYRAIFFDNEPDNLIGMWRDEITIIIP